MRKIRTLCALVAACALVPAASAHAAVQKVTPNNVATQPEDTAPTSSWVFYYRVATPGTGAFVTGPATPPLGTGSFQLSTVGGSDKGYLFNFDHVGDKLSAISAMGYSTYRSAGNDQQVAAMNIQVDYNGPDVAGGFTTLVFEPVYNTAQGAVVSNQWQTWNAYDGGNATWWSSKDIPGVCAFTCYATWSDIVAANPDATILGGYGINQGSGNPNLTTAVDALVYNDTTYNLDPLTGPPTSKDQCKNGGWQSFNEPAFKNQGDCVSYVATGGKNPGNG